MPSPQCFQAVWWRLAVRSPKTALKLGWTQQSRITCLSSGHLTPSTGTRHSQHLALYFCTTLQCLQHTYPGVSNTAVPQLSPSPLHSPNIPTVCARQTNEDHSKRRSVLKYNTQSHHNTAVCPDGSALLHYWLLQGHHAL